MTGSRWDLQIQIVFIDHVNSGSSDSAAVQPHVCCPELFSSSTHTDVICSCSAAAHPSPLSSTYFIFFFYVEATDKLDPHKRVTPTNRELFAQGTGNIVSGMIGGLAITQVIVSKFCKCTSRCRIKIVCYSSRGFFYWFALPLFRVFLI